jgi:hypothetical protein
MRRDARSVAAEFCVGCSDRYKKKEGQQAEMWCIGLICESLAQYIILLCVCFLTFCFSFQNEEKLFSCPQAPRNSKKKRSKKKARRSFDADVCQSICCRFLRCSAFFPRESTAKELNTFFDIVSLPRYVNRRRVAFSTAFKAKKKKPEKTAYPLPSPRS